MDCFQYGVLISKFLDGECSALERVDLKKHLETCNRCHNLFISLQSNDEVAMASLQSEFFGHDAVERILARLPEQKRSSQLRDTGARVIRWVARPTVAVAATLAAAVVLLVLNEQSLDRHMGKFGDTIHSLETSLLQQQSDHDRFVEQWKQERSTLLEHMYSMWTASPAVWPQIPNENSGHDVQEPADSALATGGGFEQPSVYMALQCDAQLNGNVLSWTLPSFITAVGFNIHRVDGHSPVVTTPRGTTQINAMPVHDLHYTDAAVFPNSEYIYRIEAIDSGEQFYISEPVRILSRNDTLVDFIGVAERPDGKRQAFITVHKKFNDEWTRQTFTVRPGEAIGAPRYDRKLKATIDYSTGFKLAEIEVDQLEYKPLMRYIYARDPHSGDLLLDSEGKPVKELITQQLPVLNNRIAYRDIAGGMSYLWQGQNELPATEPR